jgi:PKD repeat protein
MPISVYTLLKSGALQKWLGKKSTSLPTPPPKNIGPTAAFTSSSTSLAVTFNGTSSSDADGTIVSYAWNFGDGATGTGATVTHTYPSAGTYSVTLTVTDNMGATNAATASRSVTTNTTNTAPSASFTATANDLLVTVNGAGSTDPGGAVTAYTWNWGDGTANSSGVSASHTYATAGVKTITLTVSDAGGLTGATTRTVTAVNPDSPEIQARRALRDDGVLDGGVTRDPYDSTLPALYPLNDNNWGLLPGYADGVGLTVVTGNQKFTDTSATVKLVENKYFKGNVVVTGANYYFRNCLFAGNAVADNNFGNPGGSIFTANASTVANNVLEDCEVRKEPINNPNGSVGIWATNLTLRRVKVHRVEDGFRPYGPSGPTANVNVHWYGSFIGDLLFKSLDSEWGGGQSDHMTHNDNTQFNNGAGNVYYHHCRIVGTITTEGGDALTPNEGTTGGAGHIRGNPSYTGGSYTQMNMISFGAPFMFSPKTVGILGPIEVTSCEVGYATSWFNFNSAYTTVSGLKIQNNRWVMKARDVNFAGPWSSIKGTANVSGNRWAYTGDGHTAGTLYNG